MSRIIVLGSIALMALALIVGTFARISINHGDTTSYLAFLAQIAIPAIPAVGGWIMGSRAHGKAAEAVDKADTAAVAAVQAESNTNGRMAAQFSTVVTKLDNLSAQFEQHLADHNGESGGH